MMNMGSSSFIIDDEHGFIIVGELGQDDEHGFIVRRKTVSGMCGVKLKSTKALTPFHTTY